jgi:hypothetical protein
LFEQKIEPFSLCLRQNGADFHLLQSVPEAQALALADSFQLELRQFWFRDDDARWS